MTTTAEDGMGCPSTIEFCIERGTFGSGGFCDVYKATSLARGFASKTWVCKKEQGEVDQRNRKHEVD